jgi:hypothetical protein
MQICTVLFHAHFEEKPMFCPYNRKTETTVLQWSQSPDDDPGEKSGQQVTVVGFELMKCREQHGGTDLYGA